MIDKKNRKVEGFYEISKKKFSEMKLITYFLIISIFIGIVGIYSIFSILNISDSYSGFEKIDKKLNAAVEASSFAKRAESHLIQGLILDSEEDIEKFAQRLDSLKEQIDILNNELDLLESQEHLNILEQHSADLEKYGNELLTLYRLNQEKFEPTNHANLIRKFHESSSGARKSAISIVNFENSRLNTNIKSAIKDANKSRNIIFILILITFSSSIILGIFVSQKITKPIKKLSTAVDEVSKGNFNVEIDTEIGINEINILAKSLNRVMVTMKLVVLRKGPLKTKSKQTAKISEKDFAKYGLIKSKNSKKFEKSLENLNKKEKL